MRALRYDTRLALVTNEPDPSPASDEAVIRLRLAGICHTDLELTRGYMGFQGILGHEFVGEILTESNDWKVGQRVVGEINIACGHCDLCAAGIPSQCRNRSTLGIDRYPGAFADCLRVPFRNLHAVPDNVPDEMAVFTEPLAAALQVTELVPIQPSDRVVVIGAGKLGLLIAQVLALTGCDLTVIAHRPTPISLLDKWGIHHVASASQLPRQQAHVIVDATGNEQGFASSLDLVRPRGTIVLKSTYANLPKTDMTRLVVDEVRLVGSRCGPFDKALHLMVDQKIDLVSMIERRFWLDAALMAFQYAAQPGVLKVLLSP